MTDGIAAELFMDRAPRSRGFAQSEAEPPTVAALRLELCGAVWCLPGFSEASAWTLWLRTLTLSGSLFIASFGLEYEQIMTPSVGCFCSTLTLVGFFQTKFPGPLGHPPYPCLTTEMGP